MTVYRPVARTTITEPIQKLSSTMFSVTCHFSSGKRTPDTTPPAKIPTASFVST